MKDRDLDFIPLFSLPNGEHVSTSAAIVQSSSIPPTPPSTEAARKVNLIDPTTAAVLRPRPPTTSKASPKPLDPKFLASAAMSSSSFSRHKSYRKIPYVPCSETDHHPLPQQGPTETKPVDFIQKAIIDAVECGLSLVPSARDTLFSDAAVEFLERAFWWLYLRYLSPHDTLLGFEAFLAEEIAKHDRTASRIRAHKEKLEGSQGTASSAAYVSYDHLFSISIPRHLSTSENNADHFEKLCEIHNPVTSTTVSGTALLRMKGDLVPHRRSSVSLVVAVTDTPRHFHAVCEKYCAIFRSLPERHAKDTTMRLFPEIMANALFRALRHCFPYLRKILTSKTYVSMYQDITFLVSGVERSKGYIVPHENGHKRKTSRSASFRSSLMDSGEDANMSSANIVTNRPLMKGLTSDQMLFKKELDDIMRGKVRIPKKPVVTNEIVAGTKPQSSHDGKDASGATTTTTTTTTPLNAKETAAKRRTDKIIRDVLDSIGPKPVSTWYECGRRPETRALLSARENRTAPFDVMKLSPAMRVVLGREDFKGPNTARGSRDPNPERDTYDDEDGLDSPSSIGKRHAITRGKYVLWSL